MDGGWRTAARSLISLDLHTEYTRHRATKTYDLTPSRRNLQLTAAATMTDKAAMFGDVDANDQGSKPIIGSDVYAVPRSRRQTKRSLSTASPKSAQTHKRDCWGANTICLH